MFSMKSSQYRVCTDFSNWKCQCRLFTRKDRKTVNTFKAPPEFRIQSVESVQKRPQARKSYESRDVLVREVLFRKVCSKCPVTRFRLETFQWKVSSQARSLAARVWLKARDSLTEKLKSCLKDFLISWSSLSIVLAVIVQSFHRLWSGTLPEIPGLWTSESSCEVIQWPIVVLIFKLPKLFFVQILSQPSPLQTGHVSLLPKHPRRLEWYWTLAGLM